MNANSKMIVNTGIMYTRVVLTMGVTLLSSRWVLMALGEEDYGIYILVAGVLAMLSFLNVTMASSTQRFLSYSLGKGDEKELNSVFNLSCRLHLIIGLLVLVLFEVVGSFLLDRILQIPIGKESDAIFVLHSLSISMFIAVVTVPYNASLIAHENMLFVAVVQISEALQKLVVAYILLYYSGVRIRLYAVCMMIIPVISNTIYIIYCNKKYAETKISLKSTMRSDILKDFASYTSWNLIGGISHLFKVQGIAMLLNTFMGVVINAAFGIASQINSQLQFFSSTIVTATKPQIVKSEGMGNRTRMLQVSVTTCKLTFLMLAVLVAPFITECDYILNIWLKEVPNYTVQFAQLFLVTSLIRQLYTGVSIGIESVGSIKYLQIFVGGLHFLVLPVGYILLKLDQGTFSIFYMLICEETLCLIITILISKCVTGLDSVKFVKKCICPCIFTFLVILTFCLVIRNFFVNPLLRVIFECGISIVVMVILSYLIVLNNKEKSLVNRYVSRFVNLLKFLPK